MFIRSYLGEYLPASTNLILKISKIFNIKVHIKVSEEGLNIRGNLIYTNG